MSPVIDRDDLREQHKESIEWDIDPVKRAVIELLGSSLNDESYRKLSKEEVVSIVERTFQEKGFLQQSRESVVATRLLRRLNKAASCNDAILVLGEYILQ